MDVGWVLDAFPKFGVEKKVTSNLERYSSCVIYFEKRNANLPNVLDVGWMSLKK